MTIAEVLTTVRYVLDTNGKKTEVILPLPVWEALLASWGQLIDLLEDQADRAIVEEWLEKRANGEIEMIPLEELENELITE